MGLVWWWNNTHHHGAWTQSKREATMLHVSDRALRVPNSKKILLAKSSFIRIFLRIVMAIASAERIHSSPLSSPLPRVWHSLSQVWSCKEPIYCPAKCLLGIWSVTPSIGSKDSRAKKHNGTHNISGNAIGLQVFPHLCLHDSIKGLGKRSKGDHMVMLYLALLCNWPNW